MLITATPDTTTPPATGKNTPPENNQNTTEDTQEVPTEKTKLGRSRWPFLSQNKNQVSNTKSEAEVNSVISPANQVNSTTKDVVEENPNKKSPAHIPQIPPTSIVKSQNDDARRETREEAALLVQGG